MMKKYGERFGADFSRWMFLTGTKAEIGALGAGSLKLSAVPEPPADQTNAVDLFIHTTIFVIVDKHARLRGSFETRATAWTGRTRPAAHRRRRAPTRTRAVSIHDLPAVNASLNGLSAVFLTAGFVFIKRGDKIAHRNCMMAAFVTSIFFLACYLTYHAWLAVVLHQGPTRFLEPPWFRPIYLAILLTHTVLAMVIVPMILVTLNRARMQRFERTKKSRAGRGRCGCMCP